MRNISGHRLFRRFGGALLGALLTVFLLVVGCGEQTSSTEKRIIVLGFDGMDYAFTKELMAAGQMPHFSKVAEMGGFQALGTAVPPQSPVAWSDFITGMDSGGHGIFDFIHRKPDTLIPYLSTSEVEAPDKEPFQVGDYLIPNPFASSGGHKLLRHGEAFWEVLERNGIPTHIIRIPANFPVTGAATHELSGMGTPDITGSYGTFHFYTSKLFAFAGQDIGGGEVHEVWPEEGILKTELYGPPNPFLAEGEKLTAELTVYLDPEEDRALFDVGGEEVLLEAGEWSGWMPVDFEMIPTQSLAAEARFYLRSVRPELEFYVSPLNYDPLDPGAPISTPPSFAAELAKMSGGRYYTQGMPEETNGLREDVLTHEEFLQQARIAGDEYIDQYKILLGDDDFNSGLFFYYFGNIDLTGHMMWHTLDPGHPVYEAERDEKWKDLIPSLYREADDLVGYTLENMGENSMLLIMSDHGFSSWRRSFHLNSWLEKEGYLTLKGPHLENDPGFFVNVDWSKTRAYGVGMSGLYINLRGRDKNGIVDPSERDALLAEIGEKLLEEIDPKTETYAVTKVYQREDHYKDRGALEIGPDMIVGYAKGTRGSNESAMGEVPKEIIIDNTTRWTGDHMMDHETVPGILLYDRPLKKPASNLKDLSSSILAEFGIAGFPTGQIAEQESGTKYVVLARR